jgi:peroxiredoxin family protein
MPADAQEAAPLGILLLSGAHERAHYAFVLAAAAAALGRAVVMFASNEGCRALCRDWSGLDEAGRDAGLRARGLPGIGELREAAAELGVRRIACDLGLRIAAIPPDALDAGVEIAGVATFLDATRGGQMLTL